MEANGKPVVELIDTLPITPLPRLVGTPDALVASLAFNIAAAAILSGSIRVTEISAPPFIVGLIIY